MLPRIAFPFRRRLLRGTPLALLAAAVLWLLLQAGLTIAFAQPRRSEAPADAALVLGAATTAGRRRCSRRASTTRSACTGAARCGAWC